MRHLITAMLLPILVACGDEGPPNPVPIEGPDIADAVEPGEKIRTVETRNPMQQSVGNLLVDGGFELSIVVEGTSAQSGWRAFDSGFFGLRYLRGGTGGLCRSGLRCGWLDPRVLLIGEGTAANGTGMIASIYTKPPEGQGCATLSAELITCSSFQNFARMFPASEEPGPDGWCHFRARVPRQGRATCMLIESSLIGEATLLDDASLVPDSGQTPLSTHHEIPETKFEPLRGERRERIRAIVEWRRNNMKLGTPFREQPQIGSE